ARRGRLEARGNRPRTRHGGRLVQGTIASRARLAAAHARRSGMNDFEMQRRLRGMNTARAPRSDLWPAIATRIATRGTEVEAMPRRRFQLPLAAAAALLLAVTAGVLLQDRHAPPAMPVADATPAADARESLRISPREAADIARARGSDPRV